MGYTVYCHENLSNHKKYVGITCNIPSKRWGTNGNRYSECPHFWHAIQKYGWDQFDHQILFTDLTEREAKEKEIELISEWNLTDPDYGYNIRPGGDGFDSETSKQLWADDEYKSYAASRMKEAWKDPDKRKRRSDAAKNRWANDAFRESMSISINEACAKKVKCIETDEVFPSIKEAAESIGVSDKNAQRAIKRGYRWGGFHWTYVDDIS